MTLPQDARRELMREVGRVLRPLGFRGSVNHWRCATSHGLATVECSSVKARGAVGLAFRFHPSVTPRVWWEWKNWERQSLGEQPLPLDSKYVSGLRKLESADTGDLSSPNHVWAIRRDPDNPEALLDSDLDHVRKNLPSAITAMGRRVLDLTGQGQYLKELLALPQDDLFVGQTVPVLLSEYGASRALDESIENLKTTLNGDADEGLGEVLKFIEMKCS